VLVVVAIFIVLMGNIDSSSPINSCPKLAPRPRPNSIKNLRPDDISVVMALGDSITAAFGLKGAYGGLEEYRGQSWSIGGDSDAVTLANFFKYYNSSVQGASLSNHIVEVCMGPFCPGHQYWPDLDVLNAAQSGAWIQNLPYQIKYLKAMLKKTLV